MARYSNWLLHACTPADLALLGPLEYVEFDVNHVAVFADRAPSHIWFVERGFFSIQRSMRDGRSVEIGYVGNRGVFPIQANLGDGPLGLSFVAQRPGHAWLAPVATVRKACGHIDYLDGSRNLRILFRDAIRAAIKMLEMSSACHALHSEDARLVRRLLAMTRDEPRIDVTQEFLAQMVGVSRQTVIKVLAQLSAVGGLISHRRGSIEVLDRAGLREFTCECYEIIETIRIQLRMDAPEG